MEFMDIILTKGSSLMFVHVIHSPNFYCSCFNNPYKQFVKQEYFYEKHFVESKTESSKPDTNSSLRRVVFNPKPKIKMMFKNSISGCLPWSFLLHPKQIPMDLFFECTLLNSASSGRPLDSTVSEDAGIEPRIVATLALAVRRSNQAVRSHLLFFRVFQTTPLLSVWIT
jgi:hypothetical protein